MQRNSPLQWLFLAAIVLLYLSTRAGGGPFGDPTRLLLTIIALIVAITVHEFNHAFVAHSLGDPTPKLMGRVTLNPISHLDPIGTLLLFIAGFGWGQPVLFHPLSLRINPALGSSLVSVAGPFANVLLAFALARVLEGTTGLPTIVDRALETTLRYNLLLAAFNLVPVPPLDGFGFVLGLLPRPVAAGLAPLATYGPLILIALLFLPYLGGPDVIGAVMDPVLRVLASIVLLRPLP